MDYPRTLCASAFKSLAPHAKYVRSCFAFTHYFVPGAGLEPAHPFKGIFDLKSKASTIPPSRHVFELTNNFALLVVMLAGYPAAIPAMFAIVHYLFVERNIML